MSDYLKAKYDALLAEIAAIRAEPDEEDAPTDLAGASKAFRKNPNDPKARERAWSAVDAAFDERRKAEEAEQNAKSAKFNAGADAVAKARAAYRLNPTRANEAALQQALNSAWRS